MSVIQHVPVDDKWLCTKQVANYTSMSASFYEKARWRRSGPPHHKIGGKVLYRKSDVDQWLDAQRQVPEGSTHD